jgi:hypothetical protein
MDFYTSCVCVVSYITFLMLNFDLTAFLYFVRSI